MIQNNEELVVVQKQIDRIKSALDSLRDKFVGHNQRQFEVLAEGYIDQIDELQNLVDEFYRHGKLSNPLIDNKAKAPQLPDQSTLSSQRQE